MMCQHIAKQMGECVERASASANVELDFSEVFSGPLYPLTRAVQEIHCGVKRVQLVSRQVREKALQGAQPKLQRVGA